MLRCDALVIGGGPAGAAAAIRLASAGRKVVVLEKAAFPRRKVCGEFVAPAGIRELHRLGIGPQFDAAAGPEIRRIAVWLDEAALEAPLPPQCGAAPYPRALARDALDRMLLEHAGRCGAEVLQPARALSLRHAGDGTVCRAAARRGAGEVEIHARVVIAAHGSWEPGALPSQPPHLKPAAGDLLAFKTHLRGSLPPHTLVLAPFRGGYGGLLDRGGGHLTYACCVRRDVLQRLRRPGVPAGESVLAFVGFAREAAWLAAGPLRPGRRPLYRDGIFAVGNAAGEPHSVVGEGITMALRSSALLCEPLACALGGSFDPRAVARRYAWAWHRELALKLWTSARLAALAMQPSSPAGRMLRRAPALLNLAIRMK